MSYAVIGGWIGVDARTICRWMVPLSAYGWRWLHEQHVHFSGHVAVAEQHITIGGVTWYLFVHQRMVVPHVPVRTQGQGYRPHVMVTDGWDASIKAIEKAFPHANHALCRFHLIRSVFMISQRGGRIVQKNACSLHNRSVS